MSRGSSFSSIQASRDFDDSEQARAAEVVEIVVLPLLGAALLFAAVSLAVLPDGGRSAMIAAAAAAVLMPCSILARRGRPKAAGALLTAILLVIATGDQLFGGGVSAPGQSVYFVAILMAGFVLGGRSAAFVAALSLLASGGVFLLEARDTLPESLIARDDATYWWAQAATIVAISGVLWVALRRIRVSMEDADRSEQLHRLVASSASDMIWSMSPDGAFTYASSAVESILGYTTDEILSMAASQALLAEGSPDVAELTRRALAEGTNVLRFEAQHIRKDGSTVWCEISNTLVFDDEGNHIGITGVTRDISARKHAEKQHGELEEQFRQAQKMEAVGQLAGGIAHDFNNYLTVILGNAEMIALETQPEKSSSVGEITEAALRSAELTRQLLAFSRKQVLQPVVLDMNRTIRDADRLLRRVLGEDIAIETICAGELGSVLADPNQLEQIMLNLAVNARTAMPDGGALTIETGNVYLDCEYGEHHVDVTEGWYVMLAVSDDGVGISDEVKSRIFEPFFTTSSTTGTGLGLSTVHGIVKQSGGSIKVYSEVGEGTTFRIYLPRVDATPDNAIDPTPLDVEGNQRGSETVLVVEDQEMVLALARRILEAAGYRVLAAENTEAAVQAAEANAGAIDLLMTDIVLPGTSGVELAAELSDRFGLRVLYMSGFTENGTVHRGVLASDVLLLRKPFSARELLRKVREALTA